MKRIQPASAITTAAPAPAMTLEQLKTLHLDNLTNHVKRRRSIITQLSQEIEQLSNDTAQLGAILGLPAKLMQRLYFRENVSAAKTFSIELHFLEGEDKLVQEATDLLTTNAELKVETNDDKTSCLIVSLQHSLFKRPIFIGEIEGERVYFSVRDCICIWQQMAINNYNQNLQDEDQNQQLFLNDAQQKIYHDIIKKHGDESTPQQDFAEEMNGYTTSVFSVINSKNQELQRRKELLLFAMPESFPESLWNSLLPLLYLPHATPEEAWEGFLQDLGKPLIAASSMEIQSLIEKKQAELAYLPEQTTYMARLDATLGSLDDMDDETWNSLIGGFTRSIEQAVEAIKQQLPIREWPNDGMVQVQTYAVAQMKRFKEKRDGLRDLKPSAVRSQRSAILDQFVAKLNNFSTLRLKNDIPFKSETLDKIRSQLQKVQHAVHPELRVSDSTDSKATSTPYSDYPYVLKLQDAVNKLLENKLPRGKSKYNQLPAWEVLWQLIKKVKEIAQDRDKTYSQKAEAVRTLLDDQHIGGIFVELMIEHMLAAQLEELDMFLDILLEDYDTNIDVRKVLVKLRKQVQEIFDTLSKPIEWDDEKVFVSPIIGLCSALASQLGAFASIINYREEIADRVKHLARLLPATLAGISSYKEIQYQVGENLPQRILVPDDKDIPTIISSFIEQIEDAIGHYSYEITKNAHKPDDKMQKEENIINLLIPFLALLKDPDFRRGLRENPEGTLASIKPQAADIDSVTKELPGKHSEKALVPIIDKAIKAFADARKQATQEKQGDISLAKSLAAAGGPS